MLTNIAFCAMLERHPDKLHLIAGVSITTARLNILDCDGYGMTNYFAGRCREGKYKGRDCLFVRVGADEKIVLVSGGGKLGDEKLIKGNTYGMAYVTEANECAEVFLKEVFDRTLSSSDRKVFHDLNPKSPGHWYYDLIKHHHDSQSENPGYGYNYGHFTIADNMSVSDAKLRKALSTYDKSSVWYDRDILGKRCAPEGLVYPMFNKDRHIATDWPEDGDCYISIDYGTINPFSAHLWLMPDDDDIAYCIGEYYYDSRKERGGQRTDEEHYEAVEKLAGERYVGDLIIDPSAASFKTTVRRHGRFRVSNAKNNVVNGIANCATLLKTNYIKFSPECVNMIREFGLYSWADKKDKDTVIEENDHCMDDMRYYVNTVLVCELRDLDWVVREV